MTTIEEASLETRLYMDLEFCLDYYCTENADKLQEAIETLKKVQKQLENYGHNIELCEIVESI